MISRKLFPRSKNFAVLFASALALAGLAGCNSAAPANKPLVASGHPDWPPVMFKEGTNIDGVGPALARKIFADLGIPGEIPYAGAWDEVQAKARSGEVDMLVAAYKTTAREEYMAYSNAYTTDPLVVYVKKGREFPFTKNSDLIGKKGVGTVGDSYGQNFDHYIEANLTFARATTPRQALDMVESGQADYFIYSLYSGHEELKTEGRSAQFSVLPRMVAEEPFYMTISKKSPYLQYLPQINSLLAKYKSDGTIDALTKKYKAQFHIDEQIAPPASN